MKVSGKGVNFVAGWEGFRSCPYRDAVGVWTRGYGETQGIGPNSRCISEDDAKANLKERLNRDYLSAIPKRSMMRQHELDALASFAYNLGAGAVSDRLRSTLARRLKSKEARGFVKRKRIYKEELPKWVNAGGRPLPGLVKRRAAEVALAINGDYSGRP